ncbi:ubiquinol oxidase subunit II [Acuticoccus sp. I52.16.1]|uniref:ubiquinol oxidase subunit II n=1 Tax=Acuticoccus sp. I52.16.1 TaxID=2928472 RepID=UPI001FD06B7E|nr:ubiquinol oxidase subunit II [Acuticoccus sp. I52.16.1]UOM35351.1 ubiquinol oxidase subunit II [Acuticoccus sp. I52.16.1]
MRPLRFLLLLPLLVGLGGCNFVVLDPSGHIAAQQRDLLVISTGLMLLIIVPVMALTVLFAFRYRHSNTNAKYDPEWHHSTILELVIWSAPLAIIICLGALTYLGTHLLDPYRPLARIDHDRPVEANVAPLEVQVVALDWKWLFIYPQYGVASVNEMAAPVDRPINFKLTSSAVMNAFYVPALAGMIYTMAGMETRLHAVMNEPGTFKGFSSNYSGEGFSGMRFEFQSLDDAAFDGWIEAAKSSGATLDRARYLDLVAPSENVPVETFASVEDDLFQTIVEQCVKPGSTCMSELMADASGFLCGPRTTEGLNAAITPGLFTTAELEQRFAPVRGAGLRQPHERTWDAATQDASSAPTNL